MRLGFRVGGVLVVMLVVVVALQGLFATAARALGGDDFAMNLWITGARGTSIRQLTWDATGGEWESDWSPTGEWIVYANKSPKRPLGSQLRLVRPNGSRDHELTTGEYDDDPAWSPSGNRVAFVRSQYLGRSDEWRADLFTVGADGRQLRRLTRGGADKTSPSWSPDGRSLAFVVGKTIYVMRADGTHRVRVACCADSVDWSPDNTRLAYAYNGVSYLVNLDGTERSKLSDGDDPAWSPDSKQIALGGYEGLVVARLDGGKRPKVVKNQATKRGVASPTWSPDGRHIAFSTAYGR